MSKSNISQKNFYRMVEFLSIISVVLLQSRLGLASMILIYVMMFFYFKVSKKQFFVPLLMVLLSLSAINYWNLPLHATLKDGVKVIRDDEAGHRDVNHSFADVIDTKVKPKSEIKTNKEQIKPL